jgi:hypothetical protein
MLQAFAWLFAALLVCTVPLRAAEQKTVNYPNGDVYKGELKKGQRHGRGHMKYANGREYHGEWAADQRQGYGEQTWKDNHKYISYRGYWAQNLPNGTGTLAFRSGQIYSGGFKDGRFQGEGWITYANGRMEHGNYIQSKREGHFILRTPDGKRWKEFFVADERKSVTRLETPAQDKVTNRGAFTQQLDDSRIPIGLKVKGFGDNTDLPRLGIAVGDVLQELCDIRMAMTLDYQRADRILQAKEKPCTVKVLRKGQPLTLNDIHEPSKS